MNGVSLKLTHKRRAINFATQKYDFPKANNDVIIELIRVIWTIFTIWNCSFHWLLYLEVRWVFVYQHRKSTVTV